MYNVVTDYNDIIESNNLFHKLMDSFPCTKAERIIGFYGGSVCGSINYYDEYGFWFANTLKMSLKSGKLSVGKIPHFWHPFGIQNPESIKNMNITTEINIPHSFHRGRAGVFIINENNDFFIGSRGHINTGGISIRKENFFEQFKGTIVIVRENNKYIKIALVCKLEKNQILQSIKEYVYEINRIKIMLMQSSYKRGFSSVGSAT